MRDHLRAVFVLLHILAIGLLCVPAPVGALNDRTYNNPSVQAIFEEYAQALHGMGVSVGRAELQDWAWRAGRGLLSTRRVLIRPFRAYTTLTGTHQGWRMFGMINRQPARLEVHAQTVPGGDWEPVYVMRSAEHNWRQRTLDQERVRSLLNDFSHLRNQRRFRRVAAWFAREVHQTHPDALRVRVSMVVLPSPTPATLRAEGRVAPGKRRWSTTTELPQDLP